MPAYPTRAYTGVHPILELPGLSFYSDTLNTGNYSVNGSNQITQWNNLLSGSSINVTNGGNTAASPTLAPTAMNGFPAFQFQGYAAGGAANTTNFLQSTTGFPSGNHSIIMLHLPTAVPVNLSTGNDYSVLTGSTNSARCIQINNNPFANYYNGTATSSNELPLCPYLPNSAEILILTWDNISATYNLYQNGICTRYTNALANHTIPAGFQIGTYGGTAGGTGNGAYSGYIAAFGVTSEFISYPTAIAITDFLAAQYGLQFENHIFVGDSLTTSYLSGITASQTYPYLAGQYALASAQTRGRNVTIYNDATYGDTTVQQPYKASNTSFNFENDPSGAGTYTAYNYATSAQCSNPSGTVYGHTRGLNYMIKPRCVVRNRLTFALGTNDLWAAESSFNATSAVYNNIVSDIQMYANTGLYTDIMVKTILPRGTYSTIASSLSAGSDGQNSNQAVYNLNQMIISGMNSGGSLLTAGATYLCNHQNNALGVFSNSSDGTAGVTSATNTTYYQSDKTHLTTAGYAQVALDWKAAWGY